MAPTRLPGQSNNTALAAHRDTFFRPLRNIRQDDSVVFTDRAGQRRSYRVVSTRVVEPTAVEVLEETEQPTLTLITCYPFDYIGAAPQGYIVRAAAETLQEPVPQAAH